MILGGHTIERLVSPPHPTLSFDVLTENARTEWVGLTGRPTPRR